MTTKLLAPRGADFPLAYIFPNETDLAGFTSAFRVFDVMNGTALLTVTATPTVNGSVCGVDMSDTTMPMLTVSIKAEDINALPLNAGDSTQPSVLWFDYIATTQDGARNKLHGGPFIVEPRGSKAYPFNGEILVNLGAQDIDVTVISTGFESAGTLSEIKDLLAAGGAYVRFDADMGLTDAFKAQARTNINAYSASDAIDALTLKANTNMGNVSSADILARIGSVRVTPHDSRWWNSSDHKASILAAITYVQGLGGGVVDFNGYTYSYTGDIEINPANGPVYIDGGVGSRVSHTGAGAAIYFNNQGGSVETFCGVRGVFFGGNGKPSGSTGIKVNACSYMSFEDTQTEGFDLGWDFQDCDHIAFWACTSKYCGQDFKAYKNPVDVPGISTRPNNFAFNSCRFASSTYGVHIIGGGNTLFSNGSNEHSGTGNALGYGVWLEEPSYQAWTAATFIGVNFEDPNGLAGVRITKQNTDYRYMRVVFLGCSFARAYTNSGIHTDVATNHIRCDFNAANSGPCKLIGFGNTMASTSHDVGGYVPDAGRPLIAFTDDAASIDNFHWSLASNSFQDALETPSFVGKGDRFYGRYRPSSDVTCSSGISNTVFTLATTVNNWSDGGLSGGGVKVVKAVPVDIEAKIVFTGFVSGDKRIVVQKNGSDFISLQFAGQTDTMVLRFSDDSPAVNDVYALAAYNNTGSTLTASATGSYLKVCQQYTG